MSYMKFLFQKLSCNFWLFFNSQLLCFFMKKVVVFLLLGLSICASFANTKTQSISNKNPDKLQYTFSDKMKKKKEWKARGVIIKFHHWPNAKQQKEIIKRLKANGLKQTKSIRKFKAWLFEWSKGGLKSSGRANSICKN